VPLKLYIAAPLFSEAERRFNLDLKQQLSTVFRVYLPQDDGGLYTDLLRDGISAAEARSAVFRADIEELRSCDLLLIVLDGRTIDEGACFELGYAYAIGKRCIGLQTDSRRLLPSGNNPMIDSAVVEMFSSCQEILIWAKGSYSSGA